MTELLVHCAWCQTDRIVINTDFLRPIVEHKVIVLCTILDCQFLMLWFLISSVEIVVDSFQGKRIYSKIRMHTADLEFCFVPSFKPTGSIDLTISKQIAAAPLQIPNGVTFAFSGIVDLEFQAFFCQRTRQNQAIFIQLIITDLITDHICELEIKTDIFIVHNCVCHFRINNAG